MKKFISLVLIVCLVFSLAGCSNKSSTAQSSDSTSSISAADTTEKTVEPAATKGTITLAAAASLKNCMDGELIPLFNEKFPNIKVQATYDSSGKLQTQIEEGADIDVFMSAAMKQMTSLDEKKLMKTDSIVKLLENKIVLVVPKGSAKDIKAFEDIVKADTIAIGDPASVPAGQYAKESLVNLKLWDQVSAKSSLGTNVTEVLKWVSEGSADAGIVYATDAASDDKVQVVAEAPARSVSKVIYPVGIVGATKNGEAAKLFVEFLQSDDAMKIFEKYGFTANK